jgi:hypothetical protein
MAEYTFAYNALQPSLQDVLPLYLLPFSLRFLSVVACGILSLRKPPYDHT